MKCRLSKDYIYKYRYSLPRVTGFRLRPIYIMPESRKLYDLVVYGATGYTGQFVTEEVAKVASLEQKKGQSLTWAVAGRNKEKLSNVLKSSGKHIGFDLKNIPIIEADNTRKETLSEMASKANVVINCVGPYQIYGEDVVKACVKNGANHVDISGEPQFLEGMQLKYEKAAEEAGVHIVGACGFDSVPVDVGICYMMKKFPGVLNSVESFVKTRGGRQSSIHTGTMESAGLAVANRNEIFKTRKQLFPTKLPKPKFKKEKRSIIHKNPDLNLWCIPLPSDESTVYRSQRYLYGAKGLFPIQYQGFAAFRGMFQAVGVLVGALYFLSLCLFSWTRKLLFKYPEIFTVGLFSRAGASREALEKMSFTTTLIGKGWKEKLSESSDSYTTPPDSKVKVTISGSDPGYSATSLMLVASAMTILRQKSNCEKRGGVLTPGVAFMNTNIVDRLVERGIKISYEEIK